MFPRVARNRRPLVVCCRKLVGLPLPEITIAGAMQHRIEPPIRVRTDKGEGEAVCLIASNIGITCIVALDQDGYYFCDLANVTPLGAARLQMVVDNG